MHKGDSLQTQWERGGGREPQATCENVLTHMWIHAHKAQLYSLK